MPENLSGDQNQVNLNTAAVVPVVAAGEYRRRQNSIVAPFQRVAHFLEALRQRVLTIPPLEDRVEILENTTLGSAFVRGAQSPFGNGGANDNRIWRTRGTDGGGAHAGDWSADRTVGPSGSGADITLPALDDITQPGRVVLAFSASTMAYNCHNPRLHVGDGDLANLAGLWALLELPTSGGAVRTGTAFFVIRTDTNKMFKVRPTISGFSANNYHEYELTLQGYFR